MCFFFFKQKTAYEMRISDWSSDVCSSDLSTRDLVSSRDSGDRTWQDSSRFMSIFAGGLSSGRGRKSFKPQQRGPYEGSTQPGRHRPKVARPFRTARDCRFHRARSPVSAPSTCRSPLPSACSLRKSENRTAGKGKGCRRICPPEPTPRRVTVIDRKRTSL